MQANRFVAAVALTVGLMSVSCGFATAQPNGVDPGQAADWARPDPDQMGVSMTLYHVVLGGNGQQLMVTPNGQAVPLPGAGVNGHRVAVYHGSNGGTWYVDRTGQQVDIPPMEPGFYGNSGGDPYQAPAPYYNSNSYGPSSYYAPPQQAPATATATVNTSSGGNSGGGGGLGSFAGGLIGSALGNAVGDLAGGGLPYGAPVYYGGGGPYYHGGGGNRVFVNNSSVNSEHFNEWHNQQNWYHNQFNENGRYNHRSWAGKDHGFPAPWEGNHGRLYGQQGREGAADRRDGAGDRRDGGGEHHEGGGGHKGGGGGGHRGGGGGHRR